MLGASQQRGWQRTCKVHAQGQALQLCCLLLCLFLEHVERRSALWQDLHRSSLLHQHSFKLGSRVITHALCIRCSSAGMPKLRLRSLQLVRSVSHLRFAGLQNQL